MLDKTLILFGALALANNVVGSSKANIDPSEAPAICAAEDSEGIFVAHEDCDKFYKCYQTKPAVLECPAGFLYNAEKEWCDWPENVQCKATGDTGDENVAEPKPEPEVKETNDDPSKAGEICAAEGSDDILVAHEDCDKFYKCYKSEAVAINCPVGYLYDSKKEWCDWPENVQCKATGDSGDENVENPKPEPEVETNDDPSKAVEICAAEGSNGILVAHEDCNKFYECSSAIPVTHECAAPLVYNVDMKWCDWAFNVDCGNRKN